MRSPARMLLPWVTVADDILISGIERIGDARMNFDPRVHAISDSSARQPIVGEGNVGSWILVKIGVAALADISD